MNYLDSRPAYIKEPRNMCYLPPQYILNTAGIYAIYRGKIAHIPTALATRCLSNGCKIRIRR